MFRLFICFVLIGCVKNTSDKMWDLDYRQVCTTSEKSSRIVAVGGCDWRGVCGAILQNNSTVYTYYPVVGTIYVETIYDCKFVKRGE